MAHHQQTMSDRMHATLVATAPQGSGHNKPKLKTEEDEPGDADEPPDRPLQFSKVAHSSNPATSDGHYHKSQHHRKTSLLTQALTSPELLPFSDIEEPHLTSDGGLTSPARTSTPSPPLPDAPHMPLPISSLQEKHNKKIPETGLTHPTNALAVDRTQETKVEEGLGRKRCISFACSQKTKDASEDSNAMPKVTREPAPQATNTSKRPCMLRFVCPAKPVRNKAEGSEEDSHSKPTQPTLQDAREPLATTSTHPPQPKPAPVPTCDRRELPTNQKRSTENPSSVQANSIAHPSTQGPHPQAFNRVNYQKSEATRFHEFAGSFTEEDEWTQEQTAFRNKITINDTLRKENAIRKLAEEADAEACEDDDEDDETYPHQAELDDIEEESDGGNETDDEEGFGDSEDESDAGSAYQFWTPSVTTAATSTDHMEHIRPPSQRLGSESSVESVLDIKHKLERVAKGRELSRRHGSQPAKTKEPSSVTPDVPDSSDFMVGTIDEDQPMEDKYLSRRKRREQLKQKLIPQDIDPSFPNSDPEAENDEDDDANEDDPADPNSDGKTSESDIEELAESSKQSSYAESGGVNGKGKAKQNTSPRRCRSPAPRAAKLFEQSTHRLRSPPPMHRKLSSPPSSRRPSPDGRSRSTFGVPITRLAQRPNLTHTTSLPRTPNPFWMEHRRTSYHDSEPPSAGTSLKESLFTPLQAQARGPIDIVQGLETKRQRRKEKFWRQHTRIAHAGKDKERKCQPGKGAERMKELGLEMAGRFKGYRQETKGILSI